MAFEKGRKHSDETKALISKSRKGKCVGHAFWGPKDYLKINAKRMALKRVKVYPIRECANPECTNRFQVISKSTHQKYCSRPCANSHIGKNSKIGLLNVGKSPAEGSGRCKWYDYVSPTAGQVRVQGTWELRFANCLDAQKLVWRTNHNKDRFAYQDVDGKSCTYNPDFYVDGVYYEVKGYLDPKTKYKMEQIAKQGTPVVLMDWKGLAKLEERLFGKKLCGVNTTPAALKKISGASITLLTAPLTGEVLKADYMRP